MLSSISEFVLYLKEPPETGAVAAAAGAGDFFSLTFGFSVTGLLLEAGSDDETGTSACDELSSAVGCSDVTCREDEETGSLCLFSFRV